MLTGRTLFAGDTVTDIIAAVVKEEPGLDALPPATPPPVRRLLARCLRKDPRTRLPDIGAGRLELQEVLTGTTTETGGDAPDDTEVRRLARRGRTWAAVAVVSTGIAAILALAHWSAVPDEGPATRFVVDAPDGWSFEDFNWPVPSPDGRHIVIQAEQDGSADGAASSMLWLRSLESLSTRPLAGTEGTGFPFWSPDGRFVGVFAEGELRRLSIADGVVQRICTLPAGDVGLGAWNGDGTIVFGVIGARDVSGLFAVSANGGKPKLVMQADAERRESLLVMGQFLPDDRRFTFLAYSGGNSLGAYVGSLDAPDERHLVMPGVAQFWLADDHVFFGREESLELSGEPVAITSSLAFRAADDVGYFGPPSAGTLAYLSGESRPRVQLTWVDRKGDSVETLGAPELYTAIVLSPDEKRVAVAIPSTAGQHDVWVMDVMRGVKTRVTSDPADETNPVWSPNGQELIFTRLGETHDILRTRLHRGATAAPLLESPWHDFAEEWTRDGETLFFVRCDPSTLQLSLWALPLAAQSAPELVAKTEGFQVREPRLSPNGRWLAYISDESGAYEVYVEPFRRAGERARVSIDGGGQPKWRGDGKELFYRQLDGPLMAVEMREEAEGLEVGLPRELFATGEFGSIAGKHYAVSADGQRFLVKVPLEDERKLQMHVVVNWESLLETEG